MDKVTDSSLLHWLHRASQVADDTFARDVGPTHITPRQFIVLSVIAQNEGLSQTAIVLKTGIDRSTMADIVRRLLRAGLLSRKRTKKDARAYAVILTTEGHAALREASIAASRTESRLLANISGRDKHKLISLIQKLVSTKNLNTDEQAR